MIADMIVGGIGRQTDERSKCEKSVKQNEVAHTQTERDRDTERERERDMTHCSRMCSMNDSYC